MISNQDRLQQINFVLDNSENVSLTIVSSQEILARARISCCFSQKVSSQLQPASEEKNVEEPTDQDLSPGGIQNL